MNYGKEVRYLVIALMAFVMSVDGNGQVRRAIRQQRKLAKKEAIQQPAAQRPMMIRRRVLDRAEILLPEQEQDLEGKIRRFEAVSHIHVAILIARRLNKERVEDLFSVLQQKNRIAADEQANSVLVLVSVSQRIGRIEVGANVQNQLPIPVRRQIIQQRIMRRFKAGQFYAGVNAGLVGVINAIRPDFNPYQQTLVQGTVLSRPSLAEEPGDTIPPAITITQPLQMRGMKIAVKEKSVLFKGTATDADGVYEVSVNGIEAALANDGSFSAEVRLAVGDNKVSVKAIDTRNNVAEQDITVSREAMEAAPVGGEAGGSRTNAGTAEERTFALVIGIDKYSGGWPQLSNAAHDASGMADELTSDYKFDKVTVLLDNQATRANIIRQLEWLTDNVRKTDDVVIFYSGHGDYKKNLDKGFWVPVDAQTQSTADEISNSDIQTFLGGIPSKHTLLIADACFSGDIFRGLEEPVKKDDIQRYYEEVGRRASRQAMSSGGLEPVMDGGRDGHSVFTYYLLKALKENKDSYLDAAQLYDDIKIPVANNSDQTPVFNAIKNTGDEGGQFVFHRK
ncbi:MAG TPA: caspase family protein [Bacteroidota bacterium]|nr:caspase family protein [Bacteroidota bacterium]